MFREGLYYVEYRKEFARMKWKKANNQKVNKVIERGELFFRDSHKAWGCFARALLIFLVVFGGIGCFLTAFEIPFSIIKVMAILLGISCYCSFLFYNRLTKNLGYPLLFVGILAFVLTKYRYINSGFYAMVNIMYEKLRTILNVEDSMEYFEQIGNRDITINLGIITVGLGLIILLNALISNYMSFGWTFVITGWMLLLPLYFGLKMNVIFLVMILVGYGTIYVLKRSKHYKYPPKKQQFKVSKKKGASYYQSGAMIYQTIAFVAVLGGIIVCFTGALVGGLHFTTPEAWNKYKTVADSYIRDVVAYGFEGLFNRYEARGGLSAGQLGGVASVRSDREVDLTIQYAPDSLEPVYLRSFIGEEYKKDHWTMAEYGMNGHGHFKEAEQIKKDFDANKGGTKGKMKITNVRVENGIYNFLPYYTYTNQDKELPNYLEKGEEQIVTYYHTDKVDKAMEEMDFWDIDNIQEAYKYLMVPDENWSSLDEIANEQGLKCLNAKEAVEKVQNYFEEEYTYSLRPGLTPRGGDFIEHFLKKKKGFCAHFASTATLLFRQMGFPARYVEGYVATYDSISEGELVEGEDYKEWLQGENALGETSVINVEVQDNNAHAWVELYINGIGWVPVEVTPSNSEEEELGDFWSLFDGFMDGDGTELGNNQGAGNLGANQQGFQNNLNQFTRLLLYALVLLVALVVLRLCYRFFLLMQWLHTGSLEKNMIHRYEYMWKRLCVIGGEEFFTKYRMQKEQISYFIKQGFLKENSDFPKKLLEISYSGCQVTQEEYKSLTKQIKQLHKKAVWHLLKQRVKR